jgi:hypothetical protein
MGRYKHNLQGYHHRAIELRYSGTRFDDVARILGEEFKREFKPQTLRTWFGRKGMLFDEYEDYSDKENRARMAIAKQEMKKVMPLLPPKIVAILSRTKQVTDDKGTTTEVEVIDNLTLGMIRDLLKVFRVDLGEKEKELENPLNEFFDRLEQKQKTK